MRHLTVIGPNGEPNRVVEYDDITFEGRVFYVITRGERAGTVDRCTPMNLCGRYDFAHRIHNWLSDGCTIVPGAMGLED